MFAQELARRHDMIGRRQCSQQVDLIARPLVALIVLGEQHLLKGPNLRPIFPSDAAACWRPILGMRQRPVVHHGLAARLVRRHGERARMLSHCVGHFAGSCPRDGVQTPSANHVKPPGLYSSMPR